MNDMPNIRVRVRANPKIRSSEPQLPAFEPQTCSRFYAHTSVLGIDASVAKVGFALMRGVRVWSWVYRPKLKGIDRLDEIRSEINGLLGRYGPTHAVIEGYSFASRNSQSHATGEAGGVIRLALKDSGIELWECPPTSLKKFVSGKGNTPKTGMPLALYKTFGLDYSNEDEADAAGLALMAAAKADYLAHDMTKYQIDALSKVSKVL